MSDYAPDQSFLDTAINCGYLTWSKYPDHAEFMYLLLSRINEDDYSND
jgi:hypothetical protein